MEKRCEWKCLGSKSEVAEWRGRCGRVAQWQGGRVNAKTEEEVRRFKAYTEVEGTQSNREKFMNAASETVKATDKLARVCVFCGASNGGRPEYSAAAWELGRGLADRGITVIYGGGRAGLMGAVADAALSRGGKVVGVITKLLYTRELGHEGVTDLQVVETMHERKMMMATMADAFVTLPGGLGTFDELFEILAWAQLGIHVKPVGLLNVSGYYDGLMTFLDHVEKENFLRLDHRTDVLFEAGVVPLLDRLQASANAKRA